MRSLSDTDQAYASRDGRSSHAAGRSGHSEREERRRSDRPRDDEGRASRRSRRGGREESRSSDRRERRRSSRDERRTRDADSTRREPVSAYLDESTVVGVSTRSERRRSTQQSPWQGGFTLVPPIDEPTFGSSRSDGRSSQYGRTRPEAFGWDAPPAWGDMPSWGGASRPSAYSRPSSYEFETDLRDARPSRDDQRSSDRLPRRTRDGQSVQRDWLYTGEDAEVREAWGLARIGYAVMDGAAAVPQGIVAGLTGALSHMRGLLALALAVLTALMLYAPARELYVANRRLDTLQATYDVLLEENEAIRGDLELLQTREGIENEARARGYVEAGETKVVVEGLPESELSDPTAFLEPLEIPDNRPWHTRLLDILFGYEME